MKIYGPYLDLKKPKGTKRWFLTYFAPVLDANHSLVLDENGNQKLERHRPYFKTKDKAEAEKSRLHNQYATAGTGEFLLNREAATDYEAARNIVGDGVKMADLARFWRLHHPDKAKQRLSDAIPAFLDEIKGNLGEGRHWSDLKSRLTTFGHVFGSRYTDTITRGEILSYLKGLKNQDGSDAQPRTRRNHKTAICNLFGWLCEKHYVTANPASGIKRRMLPREVPKEIEFLPLDYVIRYLRCAERYDPDLVAHEVVQLIAGVRSDDEMGNFDAQYVHQETKEVTIPAAIAKTGKREVIDGLEENFWLWWASYGPEKGLLRPPNYEPRWNRLRILAATENRPEADRLARLPIKTLIAEPDSQSKLREWPWNARRRSFCSYHIALHKSADKTALILRHRGAASTLHDSYRGTGITEDKGRQYFSIKPSVPRPDPIQPEVIARGIVKQQAEGRARHGNGS